MYVVSSIFCSAKFFCPKGSSVVFMLKSLLPVGAAEKEHQEAS